MKPQDIKCTVFERNFLKFVQYFENTFFRLFVYDGFYKFNWERFHSNYSSFTDSTLHVKLAIKCILTSAKEKFDKQPVVNVFKNDCSVRRIFCTIFVSLSVSILSIGLFQGKFTFTWKIFWTAISITVRLQKIFWTDIFKNSNL